MFCALAFNFVINSFSKRVIKTDFIFQNQYLLLHLLK